MSKTVTAKAGECVISIAQAAGFADWRTVFNAPENAALKAKRPDPSMLIEGDAVFLPDFDPLTVTVSAPGEYTIHTRGIYAEVNLQLNDTAGEPYAWLKWELKVKDKVYKGETDSQGSVQQKVPADSTEGDLTLFLDDSGKNKLQWTIELGGMDPIETVSGVQGRLNNLGYHTGADAKGTQGDDTVNAIRAFQNDHDLPVTGKLDRATRERIQQEHQS